MLEINNIYNMDCMQGMKEIPDASIDAIICDLPYGTTACKWDTVLPLEDYVEIKNKNFSHDEYMLEAFKIGTSYSQAEQYFYENKKLGLWSHYKRIIKPKGAIVLFGSEPFSTTLRMSNLDMYKYDWIWKKTTVDGFFNAKCRPLKTIETISVFSKGEARAGGDNMVYNPQGLFISNKKTVNNRKEGDGDGHNYFRKGLDTNEYIQEYTNYPTETLVYERDANSVHPTQKPIALLEYLVKTYSNPGDLILDNCMGSGTTAIACIKNDRNYIGFELDKKYYDYAMKRTNSLIVQTPSLF